jgi:hypothetical protein
MIAVWGRAVVVDVDALGEAAEPLSESEQVVDLFSEWIDDELMDAGVDPTTADLVAEDLVAQSSVGLAFGEFVGEFVEAAADPAPGGGVVDVAGILEPTVPEIGSTLAAAGVPVEESRVAGIVSGLDPMIVREPGSRPYVGSQSAAAGLLGTAAVLSLATMVVAGWAAVAASDDRLRELRGLLNRVALGALSFSIFLKAGSWVLDPEGGRAPVAQSASILAESKWLVPLFLALAAAGAALIVWVARRIRRRAVFQEPAESPTPPEGLPLIRSG